jgi:hypothetical protein
MSARAAIPPLTWLALDPGALALSHRPRKVSLAAWRDQGATHVVTLLSEHEGAPDIGVEVKRAGLTWIWIAMAGAAIPDEATTRELRSRLARRWPCRHSLLGGDSPHGHDRVCRASPPGRRAGAGALAARRASGGHRGGRRRGSPGVGRPLDRFRAAATSLSQRAAIRSPHER